MNLSLLLCLSAFCFAQLAYASDCGQSLDGAPQDLESEISPDDRAIRWLKDLLGSELKWPAQDAHAAVARLLAGSRESPVSEGAVSNNADLYVHRLGLAELMREVSDPVAVGRALQEEIGRREGSAQSRRETKEEVELELYVRMNFGEIPPGSFSARVGETSQAITIPRRFWMQSALVTVWQLGEVLPRLRRDDLLDNIPAMKLSSLEAQEFVDKLNQWARTNDPRLLRVVPGHQPTWRYSLPHAWEWMYVASNLAANSSGLEAWRQNARLNELTLGGFTSMDQAAPYYNAKTSAMIRGGVWKLAPMIINGYEYYDFEILVSTWLRPDPWNFRKKLSSDDAPSSKALFRVQAPGVIHKELTWFTQEVTGDYRYNNLMREAYFDSTTKKDAPLLAVSHGFDGAKNSIRLIAFEADAETDARLDPNIPVDEAETIIRLGAAYLSQRIQDSEEKAANFGFKERRTHLLQVVDAALKDWKQGLRKPEIEEEFGHRLSSILQHPDLNLPRFALEVEAQLKARGVTP